MAKAISFEIVLIPIGIETLSVVIGAVSIEIGAVSTVTPTISIVIGVVPIVIVTVSIVTGRFSSFSCYKLNVVSIMVFRLL